MAKLKMNISGRNAQKKKEMSGLDASNRIGCKKVDTHDQIETETIIGFHHVLENECGAFPYGNRPLTSDSLSITTMMIVWQGEEEEKKGMDQ